VPPDAALLAVTLVGVLIAMAMLVYGMNYCLNDLEHRRIVAGGNKHVWAGVIILGGPVGQAAYWLYGRGPW